MEILSQLAQLIRRYIALTVAEADVIALWIVHTHAFVSHTPGSIGYVTDATPHAGCKVLEVK
jgi:hypothetical protein